MRITDFIDFHAKVRPASTMLIQDDSWYTYSWMVAESIKVASWLSSIGVCAGERVAILGENSVDHILLLLAVSRLGAVMVPLNYRLAVPEIQCIVEDANARLLVIVDPRLAEKREALRQQISLSVRIEERLIRSDKEVPSKQDIQDTCDVVLQLYTSGTTGRPKGVQITHDNLQSLAVASWMYFLDKPGPGTLDLVVTPLFHIAGLGTVLLHVLAGGAVLLHRQFEPVDLVSDIEKYGVNSIFLVPAMIQALLTSVPDIGKRNFSSLKRLSYGASPISPALLEEAYRVFDCRFYQAFGMTETTGTVVALTAEDHLSAMADRPELLQACGRAMVGNEIRICDSNGNTLSPGETGEIAVRSANNTPGYWNRPEESAKTIRDGWVYTGDAGFLDEEGYLFIRDRIKDMVITGGENVYPVEVERVLGTHPAVQEVAVIGVPDFKFGESLLAVCVLREGRTLTSDDVIDFCRGQIAGYKIPRKIAIIDELPRNPSGKILKTVLREPYWKQHGGTA